MARFFGRSQVPRRLVDRSFMLLSPSRVQNLLCRSNSLIIPGAKSNMASDSGHLQKGNCQWRSSRFSTPGSYSGWLCWRSAREMLCSGMSLTVPYRGFFNRLTDLGNIVRFGLIFQSGGRRWLNSARLRHVQNLWCDTGMPIQTAKQNEADFHLHFHVRSYH